MWGEPSRGGIRSVDLVRAAHAPDRLTVVQRVLVVAEHRTVAEALRTVIDLQPDLECAGVARSSSAAIEEARRAPPDVVVLDLALGDGRGVETLRLLRRLAPDARVVVLAADVTIEAFDEVADAGGLAFVAKDAPMEEVLDGIRNRTAAIAVEGTTLGLLLDHARSTGRPRQVDAVAMDLALTPRQREILVLLGEGLDAQTIARHLGLSVHTTRGHVKKILAKLGAHSQLEAVVVASRMGLLAHDL
jgi:DNA-binding NarL/FixJ family response regulator